MSNYLCPDASANPRRRRLGVCHPGVLRTRSVSYSADRIAAAAIQVEDGTVFTAPPARHPSCVVRAQNAGLWSGGTTQGFITSSGLFVTRTEAYRIALAARQLLPMSQRAGCTPGTLYFEDVW